MKKVRFLLLILTLGLLSPTALKGEEVSDYKVDFNTEINTSAHDFRVASNWKHIVHRYIDNWGDEYFMTYEYKPTYGVNESGALLAYEQKAGDYYNNEYTHDLLVTPVVSGTVKIKAKPYYSSASKAYIEFYYLNSTGTSDGELIQRFDKLSSDDYTELTINVDTAQPVAIRASYMYLDDFYASKAYREKEKSMEILTAEPSNTTGVIYWDQQTDGSVLVKFTNVTVKNTGEADLVQNEKNFSLSLFNNRNKEVLGDTVYVPQNLAMDSVSAPFDAAFYIPKDKIKSVWSYSTASTPLYLKENLQGSVVQRANSSYNAYESKFVFQDTTSTSSSSLSGKIDFGITSESATKSYAIFNRGAAPLSIVSVAQPEGFVTNLPDTAFTVAPHGKYVVNITLPAQPYGAHNGTLQIVYKDNNGVDQTYSIPVVGHLLAEGTWYTTFKGDNNSSDVVYPEGSIAEAGITGAYKYENGGYNPFLESYTNADYVSENNKFITPLLHANAGDVMTFDVAGKSYGSSYNIKVYLSTDRKEWGEPVATVTYDELTGNNTFETKSFTVATAGDYYVGFAVYGLRLDNIIGLQKVEVAHDIYFGSALQKEQIQSGDKFSSSIPVYSPLAAAADDYTVKYYVNGAVAATIESVNLTASAKDNETFSTGDITVTAETTSTYPTYYEIKFSDGTTFTSAVKDIVVTNEPVFVFFSAGTTASDSYQPSNYSGAINFGTTNTVGATKNFEIYNWGTAPLNVKSITVPEGYSVNVDTATVAAKTRQAVDVTFSAETPGTYNGDLAIVFDAAGQDSTFTVAVQGTLLDPSKWYASFESADDPGTPAWPAGSLRQSEISGLNESSNCVIYSNSSKPDNSMFITPLLKAEAGETLMFDARTFTSYWPEGVIELVAAKNRADLEDENARIYLGKWSGQNVDEDHTLTPDFKTVSVTIDEAGEYYFGFILYKRTRVDNIYGLKLVPVEHDVVFSTTIIPANAVQNNKSVAKATLHNLGFDAEADSSYTVSLYIDGVVNNSAKAAAIVPTNKMSENGVNIEIPFQSPKAGTFPVYLQADFGDGYVVNSDTVEVVFATEILSGEKVVGTPTKFGSYPLNLYFNNSETVSLYTPDELGLNEGDKITEIILKGYFNHSKDTSSELKIAYQWVDDTELAKPADGNAFDTEGMTIYYNDTYTWPMGGSKEELIDMITIRFDEPVVYEAGKSLKLLFSTYITKYETDRLYFEQSNNSRSYYITKDGAQGVFVSKNWSKTENPVLHVNLAVEPRTFTPSVVDREGNAVAGATVTLISNDGDNIQYEGTTGEDGKCVIGVIQSSRTYDVVAKTAEGEGFLEGICVNEASLDSTIVLTPALYITDDGEHTGAKTGATVYFNSVLEAGYNMVTLPIDLNESEIVEVFGENCKVYEYFAETLANNVVSIHFTDILAGMQAGKPYMVYVAEATTPVKLEDRTVVADMQTVNGTDIQIVPTTKLTPVTDGMYMLTDENYVAVKGSRATASADAVKPFRAYVTVTNPKVTGVTFDIVANTQTGIDDIDAEELGKNDVIFDLRGIRVSKPAKGNVYIINGNKVLVK